MSKSIVTKAELVKFDRMMEKRGFTRTGDRFFNPGTKVSVSLNDGVAVFSYRSEISEVKTVREFIQANQKKRKASASDKRK